MVKISVATIQVVEARAGVRRATYGQQTMWGFARNMGTDSYQLNLFRSLMVPDGATIEVVLLALRDVVLRHESLRTRLRSDSEQVLWQHLTATEDMSVEVWDSDEALTEAQLAEYGREVEQHLTGTLFDLAAQWPFRALIGCVRGRPVAVMMVVSHVAADHMSAQIVTDDLDALLTARTAGQLIEQLPTRWQPFDLSDFENSEIGTGRLARTMTDWNRKLTAAPRTLFPVHPLPPQQPQFWWGTLRSTAIPAAANMLSARYNVTTLAVLLAAQLLVLGQQAGSDRSAVEVMLSNRMMPQLRWSVGNLTQTSLVVVDLRETTFPKLMRRAWSEWLRAGTTSHYNFADLRALRRRLEHSRGIAFDLECFFNDLRTTTQAETATQFTGDELRKLAADTTFDWVETQEASNNKFFMRVAGTPECTELNTLFDTTFLPPDRAMEIMFGMERLLVWQATATDAEAGTGLDPATLAEVTGVSVPRLAPGWIVVDGVRVDLAAVADLVRLTTEGRCTESAVLVRSGPDGALMVAYLAASDPDAPPTPHEVHDRCVAALANPLLPEPQWLCAMTPHHYVICAGPPVAGSGDGWDACPVLLEGSGR